MSFIPDTEQKIRTKISRYHSAFKKEEKEIGCISDGYGKRYILFTLYLVLGDNDKFSDYMDWYKDKFPDCGCEPVALLSWTLGLYRLNRHSEAEKKLAELMFSNLYFIPKILGREITKLDMWHSSNFADIDYCNEIPEEVINTITKEELEWLDEIYYSNPFRTARNRYIEIYKELQTTEVGNVRTKLVQESSAIVNELTKLSVH